jgi:hypothetical protein
MIYKKYFDKGVRTIDMPHIGNIVLATRDGIVVFGEGDDRYDIPKSEVRFAASDVLIDLPFHEIVRKYKVSRDDPLPVEEKGTPFRRSADPPNNSIPYEARHQRLLFNKGVRTTDHVHVGHIIRETGEEIIIWGHYNWRFDVPKSKIIAVGRNVILGMDYEKVFQYKRARSLPLPSRKRTMMNVIPMNTK